MFSKHKIGLAILDVMIINSGFNLGFWFVFGSGFYNEPRAYPAYFIPSVIVATIIFLSFFQLVGLYKYQAISNPIHQIHSLLQAYARVLAVFILIVFFMKTTYLADSRLTVGLSFLASFLLMVLFRVVLVPRFYYYLVGKGKLQKKALILGAGEHGKMVCRYLKINPKSYFKIIGFCDDDFNKVGTNVEGLPVFGSSYDMESIIEKRSIKEIIIAISNVKRGVMVDLIDRCKRAGVVIHVVSDLYNEVSERLEVEEFGGLRTFRIVPSKLGIIQLLINKGFDFVGSGLLLILLSPVFLIISLAIKRDSKGPVFYKSEVVGKDGNPFLAYKFRSMYIKGDTKAVTRSDKNVNPVEEGEKNHIEFMQNFIQGKENGEYYVRNENRITKIGRFLRKYSLDELPQLINVLKGDMSLVGPRFCTVAEYKFYKPWHKRRFQVKPGMTGLWQVRARSAVSYDDMVMLDLYYIENRSLFFDLEILLRTIPVVLYGKGSKIEKAKEKRLKDKLEELMGSETNKAKMNRGEIGIKAEKREEKGGALQ